MDWGVENVNISGGQCYINSHALYEVNNHNSVYSKNKRDESAPNLSVMENNIFQDGVDI